MLRGGIGHERHWGLVLYLDFDGVLHHENVLWHSKVGPYLSAPDEYKLFMHVDRHTELLEPHRNVQIVLSTSWSVRYECTKAAKNLHPSLRARVIGGTHHKRMDQRDFFNQSCCEQVWRTCTGANQRRGLRLTMTPVTGPCIAVTDLSRRTSMKASAPQPCLLNSN